MAAASASSRPENKIEIKISEPWTGCKREGELNHDLDYYRVWHKYRKAISRLMNKSIYLCNVP